MANERSIQRRNGAPDSVPRPAREEQALREVGRTAVSRAVAWGLAALFLATAFGVPVAEQAGVALDPGADLWPAWGDLGRRLAATAGEEGLLAANRVVLAETAAFEERLEEGSFLVERVVPWAQWAETALLGSGNRRAYVGLSRDGARWLYFRPDVAHVTGLPFLDPGVLEARRGAADSWQAVPEPDPRPAILGFARQLEERGISLLLVPTPVKPAIHPELLSGKGAWEGAARERPLRNPSFAPLVRELEAAGVEVFDPAPLLARAARETGRPQYLAADTHWTPEALDRVAEALARRLTEHLADRPGPAPERTPYSRRPVALDGTGDLARMLRLPEPAELFPPQPVTVQMVTRPDGALWRPESGAPVLLLGDSFTNVFSQAELGWGRGGGLAEQLSYHLGRPVDRIAVNAGGSHTTREALARVLRSDPGRLDGVRVVVYQFAVRELSAGDWKLVELPAGRVYSRAASGPRPQSRAGTALIP